MSDGTKKKQKKKQPRVGGTATPAGLGSRAGSPSPGRAGSIGAGGSRAGSPAAQTQSTPSPIRSLLQPKPFLYQNAHALWSYRTLFVLLVKEDCSICFFLPLFVS